MRRGGSATLLGLGSSGSWLAGVLTPQPAVTRVQRATVTLGAAELTHVSASITVKNSAFVRLRWLGNSCVGAAGANIGDVTCARIALNVVDATHVTVTATRAAQDGVTTVTVSVEVADLNRRFVKSIQRGVVTSGGPATITAVNTAKTELDVLGQVGAAAAGASFFGSVVLTNSTTITEMAATALTTGFQAIEWR